jgi:hypothetical protein
MQIRLACLAALAMLSGGQALACYTVYDRNNQVVYQSTLPPVDMSRPLSEVLPARFPGGHLVFADGAVCPERIGTGGALSAAAAQGRSPLLTDARTAAAMGVPHTQLGNGIVMVPNRPDNMRPGVVLAEPEVRTAANSAPGGRLRSDTAAMGAGPAPTGSRPGAVITEMHNPPLTAVQPAARAMQPAR